jgi:glutamyl/glutaminyl-tRNA synthetase
VRAFRDALVCLAELPPQVASLVSPGAPEPEAKAALETPEARRLLTLLAERLQRALGDTPSMDGAGFKSLLGACGKEIGVSGKALFAPVRAALSGMTHGPELPLLFDALGADRVLARLRAAAA